MSNRVKQYVYAIHFIIAVVIFQRKENRKNRNDHVTGFTVRFAFRLRILCNVFVVNSQKRWNQPDFVRHSRGGLR